MIQECQFMQTNTARAKTADGKEREEMHTICQLLQGPGSWLLSTSLSPSFFEVGLFDVRLLAGRIL